MYLLKDSSGELISHRVYVSEKTAANAIRRMIKNAEVYIADTKADYELRFKDSTDTNIPSHDIRTDKVTYYKSWKHVFASEFRRLRKEMKKLKSVKAYKIALSE